MPDALHLGAKWEDSQNGEWEERKEAEEKFNLFLNKSVRMKTTTMKTMLDYMYKFYGENLDLQIL